MKALQMIPSVDELLKNINTLGLKRHLAKKIIVDIIKDIKDSEPGSLEFASKAEALDFIRDKYDKYINNLRNSSHRRVLNCTGVVLHTNLGRAPYSGIIDDIAPLLKSYVNLEMDVETGRRRNRLESLRTKMSLISGFEDCIFVNNNAAAFMLICNTFAKGRDVIVSRGELVEIGGSFRIPEILSASQAKLREVGTTNITYLNDYVNAIDGAGIIAKVHKSNYCITGHTSEVGAEALLKLAGEHNVIFYEDMGSLRFRVIPDLQSSDNYIVSFSMDKMAGAVQAGIILSTGSIIKRLKANPIYRTVRLSKFPILYLDRYLSDYIFDRESRLSDVLKDRSADELGKRINIIRERLVYNNIKVDALQSVAEYGGGSGDNKRFDSFCLRITGFILQLNRILRTETEIPVISRIHDNSIMIDIASLPASEDELLISQLNKAFRLLEDEISTN